MASVSELVEFLESKEALRLGDSPWDPGDLSAEYDFHHVDWKRLFGRKLIRDGREDPFDLYGDDWGFGGEDEDLLGRIIYRATRGDSGEPEEREGEWDTCAWYQPIHFHGHDWGIFIRHECLVEMAGKIGAICARRGWGLGSLPRRPENFAKAMLRTAFFLFYRHELYHHRTECLGIRLHVVEGQPSYIPYFDKVYMPAKGTDDQLEEAIANAYMYRNIRSGHNGWIPSVAVDAAQEYLKRSFPRNPPGYRCAVNYLTDDDFEGGENSLKSRVQEGTLNPLKNSGEWTFAPRMNQSFFNYTSNIWTVVPRGKKPIIPPTATPFTTCSSDQLQKICEREEYRVVKGGGKGSHVKMKKAGSPMVIIPGKRSNVNPGSAKSTLEALGYNLSNLPDLLEKKA